VRIDGVPLSTLSLAQWQGRFGYVPQDPFILDASLRTNVAFGEEADEARVREALAKAQLTAVMERSAAGIDAELGERGRQISGGQAQRLAIARALYKHCDVLLLDEATSALDSITESEVYQSVEALRGEVLVLMIAHRVTTLRGCDVIFVLDGGRIVDSGSYDELAARSDLFRGLAAETDTPTNDAPADRTPQLAAP
jgi:ABC-type multidrug transport system fused ATPase/permease subunit